MTSSSFQNWRVKEFCWIIPKLVGDDINVGMEKAVSRRWGRSNWESAKLAMDETSEK